MSPCVSSRQGCGRHTVSLVVTACQARARHGDCTADESDMPHPREYDTSRKQRSTGADDPKNAWSDGPIPLAEVEASSPG